MKKIFGCMLSIFAFLFIFTNKVNAIDYSGKLGYSYTATYTEFYFVTDNENIDHINLIIESIDNPVLLTEIEDGVYHRNQTGDLKDKEYYYNVCFEDSTCVDILDPFAYTINTVGDKNVILDTNSFNVNGWNGVYTSNSNYFSNSIYAIEADKYVKQLNVIQPTQENYDEELGNLGGLGGLGGIGNQPQVVLTNSVFSKLANPTKYANNDDPNILTGFSYLEQSGIKYLEIGDLYDSNNYYSPNQSFSSKYDAYSAIKEYKELMINYKSINMNIIARMDILSPTGLLKESLKVFSNNYLTSEGLLNLNDPMIQRYIKSIYKHWVSEYKIDGFYIENASLYGNEYLSSLINELKGINKDIFIYTDSKDLSEYHLSDELQNILLGSLSNSNNEGIINGNYSEEAFDKLINAMFSGYYNNRGEYDKASKTINNIGSLKDLDIYSKIKLISGITADDYMVQNKINVALYTMFASVGVPRLIAGNEFLNTTVIPTEDIASTSAENKVCTSTNAYCYAKGDLKTLDWGHLLRYSSKLTNMMAYRNRYSYQYPSVYSMVHGESINYDKELVKSGLLYLTIDYKAGYNGDTEKTFMLINYSQNPISIPHITDRDYSAVTSLVGRVNKNDDDTTIQGITFFTFTQSKINKIPNWVYILVAFGLLVFVFGLRAILIKLLKNKRGIDYNEYKKQKIEEEKARKKAKKSKHSEMNVFETYLADDPIFNNNKKEKKKKEDTKREVKQDSSTEEKEDNKEKEES